jgi:hypothetical protein
MQKFFFAVGYLSVIVLAYYLFYLAAMAAKDAYLAASMYGGM